MCSRLRAAPHCDGVRGAHYESYDTRASALRAFLEAEHAGYTALL